MKKITPESLTYLVKQRNIWLGEYKERVNFGGENDGGDDFLELRLLNGR
jgi:hypothetical protein